MALITILICLGVQRYLNFSGAMFRLNWLWPYLNWMGKRITYVYEGNGWISCLIIIVPILFILSLLIALVYHFVGWFGYFLLNLLVLWYCLDARDLLKITYPRNQAEELFIFSYENLFGYLFWFALFGPIGLLLYYLVAHLCKEIESQQLEEAQNLLTVCHKIRGVLDWLPVRLLGLSLALAGHFSLTFKSWFENLFSGIRYDNKLVAEWGVIALAPNMTQPSSLEPEVKGLLDRSLLIWLVAIALFTIGLWIG